MGKRKNKQKWLSSMEWVDRLLASAFIRLM